MTLQELENALNRYGERYYMGVYALRKDAGFIRLLVNEATQDELVDYLRAEYPDYFEEDN